MATSCDAGIKGSWLEVVIRAKHKSEMPEGMAQFELKGKTFCLLGCPQSKFVAFCNDSKHFKLEVEISELVSLGKEALASGESDLAFLSAGESPKEPKKTSRAAARKTLEESENSSDSSSDHSSSSEDPNMASALGNLRKNWLEKATPGGKRRSRLKDSSRRHTLLQLKDKPGSSQDQGQAMLRQLGKEEDPIKARIAMQIYKDMQKTKHQRRDRRWRDSSQDSSSESDLSQDGEAKPRRSGAGKAVESFEASKRRMKRNPLKVVGRYVRDLEKELGAEGRPFRIHEGSRRAPRGKQKTLQRIHYMLSEILELMLAERWDRAALQTVLCLKSVHQAALDGGDWQVAWLLCHLPDPVQKVRFGGTVDELGQVTSYLKGIADLEKSADRLRQASWNSSATGWDQSETSSKKDKKKGLGKGKKDSKETENA
ncbi:unnamed protein product [Durusdinium trenchii]|uniref:Uncharacterized protein n=1 Tax=Durusdinium trenchii TaxID=1381693 RepID=A0ABP0HHR9_9DINO